MRRILFLPMGRPSAGSGAGERSLSLYSALKRLGEVRMVIVPNPMLPFELRPGECIVRLVPSPDHVTRWYWRKRKYLLRELRPHRQVAEMVAKLHREYKFDAFFGEYELPLIADCARLGPTFVDLDDMGSSIARLGASPIDRLRRFVAMKALSRLQRVFVINPTDKDRIGLPNVQVLPAISSQRDYSVPMEMAGQPGRILYVGRRHGPNDQGLERFVRRSLPVIRQHVPSARLRVVGNQTEKVSNVLRVHEGVDIAGSVPELTDEYRQADICICPVWTGTGTNVKLAEYASFGRAIVSTAYSAGGYRGFLEPGRDILVSDTDDGLAECCVGLLKDESRRRELGRNAEQTAKRMLTQTAINHIIEDAVRPG